MKYSFFFSYASSNDDPYLDRFYKDVSDSLRLFGLSDGYRDKVSMEGGTRWRPELVEALQTAGAFVPILTPAYFTSGYCGKEWYVFDRRLRAASADADQLPPLIHPVLWIAPGMLPQPLPRTVSDIQYLHEDYGEPYARYGVRSLVKNQRFEGAYQEFIDAFAQRLTTVIRSHAIGPVQLDGELESIPSIFMEPGAENSPCRKEADVGGPNSVQLIFVAGSRPELQHVRNRLDSYEEQGGYAWRPFLPENESMVGILAQGVCVGAGMLSDITAVDSEEHLIAVLEEAAGINKVVAIVVDTWTLLLEPYHASMRRFDDRDFWNSVVVIPWNMLDEETNTARDSLEDCLRYTFLNKFNPKDPNCIHDAIASVQDFQRELGIAIAKARMRIINISEVKKRVESGIVIAKPTISGVGGGT
ncbi:MAG: TIR domain-containing protein [Bacteroidetes bacterium]|nr:TIR domain-containing protein [Bacteroidota bacterium]